MLKNVFYINLEHRIDRKEHIEDQLNKLNWSYERFNAIKINPVSVRNGMIGCAMSHLQVLKQAKERDLDYVIIIEDDMLVENIDTFIQSLNYILENNSNYDVLLFGASCGWTPVQKINDYVACIKRGKTTTGYMVQKHYFDTLINNFTECCEQISLENSLAIDVYWQKLQQKDRWYIVLPLCVIQRPDYSDILSLYADYKTRMTQICIE